MSPDKALSSQDVCLIIKSCGEAGVSSLSWGELHIQFGLQPPGRSLGSNQETETILTPTEAAISETQEQLAQESLERAEDELRAMQLELMKIENPAEYERLVFDGKLDEVVDGSDEEARD
jgi:hypothetical protein